MTKYLFVTGGVISGIGKGVISASIGRILQQCGQKITIKKLDPYLNEDPGTMNPIEHGEVFITADGKETDLDLGYYERFNDIVTGESNSTSSGKLYRKLFNLERDGEFLGKTVQIIPHFTDQIKDFITTNADLYDIVICEIGGSIGDIEAMAFYETLRQLRNEMGDSIVFVHVTYLVYYSTTNELKTKPTQNAIKELNSSGIYPDILICRTEHQDLVTSDIQQKLALFTNVKKERIMMSHNVQNIYEVPLRLVEQGMDQILIDRFGIGIERANMKEWIDLNDRIANSLDSTEVIKIGMIGKYVELHDAYKSLIEAITHASFYHECRVELVWINCRDNQILTNEELSAIDGFIVPGGFGETGIDNMIHYISLVREMRKPMLGICLGMQMICVEYAKNVCQVQGAGSAEMGDYPHQIVKVMIDDVRLGGTMRLGRHEFKMEDSNVKKLYDARNFEYAERHRHRYDVNPEYIDIIEQNGLKIVGTSDTDNLVEIEELPDHPFYVGCQFHPEFNSSPMRPHPLFLELIRQARV